MGRFVANFALKLRFAKVLKAQTRTILLNSKLDKGSEAISPKKKVENYNSVILLIFHSNILQTIDAGSEAI